MRNGQILWTAVVGVDGQPPAALNDPCYGRVDRWALDGLQGVLAGHIGG